MQFIFNDPAALRIFISHSAILYSFPLETKPALNLLAGQLGSRSPAEMLPRVAAGLRRPKGGDEQVRQRPPATRKIAEERRHRKEAVRHFGSAAPGHDLINSYFVLQP